MNIKKQVLLNIIENLKFIFQYNNYTKESNYIVFSPKHNTISCSSRFHKMSANFNVSEIFTIDKSFAIEAKPFYSFLKKIKNEDIDVMIIEDALQIKSGRNKSKFKINSITSIPIHEKKYKSFDFSSLQPSVKNHFIFAKEFVGFERAIIVDGWMYVSNRNNIFSKECIGLDGCGISYDVLKYIVSNSYTEYVIEGSELHFKNKDGVILQCANKIDSSLPHDQNFIKIQETINLRDRIVVDKYEDSIDTIDSFLLDYKNEDKMVEVSIDSGNIEIKAGNGKNEIVTNITVTENTIGNMKFKMNSIYFKQMILKYDWFNVLEDNMIYCINEDDGIERIIGIKGLEWGVK